MDEDAPGPVALSELEGMTVVDAAGREAGELADVVALFSPHTPPVTGFIVQSVDDAQWRVAWDDVTELDLDGERLCVRIAAGDLEPASLRGDEVALVEAVLDKQVLDMERRAFVRVQDVLLEERDGRLVVTAVDAGGGALARRFGLGFLTRRLPRRDDDVVAWADVNLISLRLSRLNFVEAFAELAELHPADIADVVTQVGPRERGAVLAALRRGLAADVLQEMDDDARVQALAEMPVDRAAVLLEELDADAAADILGELPDDVAEDLLARLPADREAGLRSLAGHDADTAGGLMTTEFVVLERGTTAAEALARLRRERPDQHAMTYLYVLDERRRLSGVVSLRDLVLNDPDDPVSAFMEDDVVSTTADADDEEVGRLMTRYNLLALPVLDEERRVLGIVTLDDALDALVPDDWKRRLPRLYR